MLQISIKLKTQLKEAKIIKIYSKIVQIPKKRFPFKLICSFKIININKIISGSHDGLVKVWDCK
jgi:hypothetical protein